MLGILSLFVKLLLQGSGMITHRINNFPSSGFANIWLVLNISNNKAEGLKIFKEKGRQKKANICSTSWTWHLLTFYLLPECLQSPFPLSHPEAAGEINWPSRFQNTASPIQKGLLSWADSNRGTGPEQSNKHLPTLPSLHWWSKGIQWFIPPRNPPQALKYHRSPTTHSRT